MEAIAAAAAAVAVAADDQQEMSLASSSAKQSEANHASIWTNFVLQSALWATIS